MPVLHVYSTQWQYYSIDTVSWHNLVHVFYTILTIVTLYFPGDFWKNNGGARATVSGNQI